MVIFKCHTAKLIDEKAVAGNDQLTQGFSLDQVHFAC